MRGPTLPLFCIPMLPASADVRDALATHRIVTRTATWTVTQDSKGFIARTAGREIKCRRYGALLEAVRSAS